MWHKIKASLPGWPSKTGRELRLTGPWKRSMRLGHFVGDADFTLDPGARMVKLLFELIPETAGQWRGGFRVLSPDGAVESFALFGDQTGDWLSVIPGE